MRENHAIRSACAILVQAWTLMNLLVPLKSTPIQPKGREPLLRAALARPDSRLQTFKEQARERRTHATLPRYGE